MVAQDKKVRTLGGAYMFPFETRRIPARRFAYVAVDSCLMLVLSVPRSSGAGYYFWFEIFVACRHRRLSY